MLNSKNVPVHQDGLIIRVIGDETIIIDQNNDKMHSLDEVGGYIWEKIDNKNSIKDIALSICNDFDINFEVAQTDLFNYLENLLAKNLITVKK